MSTTLFAEDTPSKLLDLVRSMEGRELTKLIRYSWESEDEAIDEYEITRDEVFSLTAGPLLMYFNDGLVVGCSSDPSKNSVVLWVEKNERGENISELSEDDDELFAIDATDHGLWSSYLNKRINSAKIIKRNVSSAKMEELPNEVGLALSFENGAEFILSHGLHDDSDDFSVIKRGDISKDMLEQLSF